jgi:hypothetical protein
MIVPAVRVHAKQIKLLKDRFPEGATGIFDDEAKADLAGPTIGLKTRHTKIRELTLEDVFLNRNIRQGGAAGRMDRNDRPRTQTDLLPVARQAALPGFSRGGIYHVGTSPNLEEVRRKIIAGLGIAPCPRMWCARTSSVAATGGCRPMRHRLRGPDLALRPGDPAGDCAANAERISGYGPRDDELARQRTLGFAPATLVGKYRIGFGRGGLIAQGLAKGTDIVKVPGDIVEELFSVW